MPLGAEVVDLVASLGHHVHDRPLSDGLGTPVMDVQGEGLPVFCFPFIMDAIGHFESISPIETDPFLGVGHLRVDRLHFQQDRFSFGLQFLDHGFRHPCSAPSV